MNKEMYLKYLYFLTKMNSGNSEKWNECYNAWHKFGNALKTEKYSILIDKIKSFNIKYKI